MKQNTDNYARCTITGQYVFFNDSSPPSFTDPGLWAFYRVPRGVDAATFRGRVVGVNSPEPGPEQKPN